MILGASSWPWPVVRPSGYYRLSISETRAVVVDGDFWYVGKEETQVSHDEVFVVEERASHSSNVVAACGQHLLCWPVEWTAYCFPGEIELTCGDHVGHVRYVVKHSPDMLVVMRFSLTFVIDTQRILDFEIV